jgi:hypothetical protein
MSLSLTSALISLLGAELTAFTFVAALDPSLGIRALFLPAVFPIAAIGGMISALIAWPIVHITSAYAKSMETGMILCTITPLVTYLLVRFALIHAFLAPVLSLIVGISVVFALTRLRV